MPGSCAGENGGKFIRLEQAVGDDAQTVILSMGDQRELNAGSQYIFFASSSPPNAVFDNCFGSARIHFLVGASLPGTPRRSLRLTKVRFPGATRAQTGGGRLFGRGEPWRETPKQSLRQWAKSEHQMLATSMLFCLFCFFVLKKKGGKRSRTTRPL